MRNVRWLAALIIGLAGTGTVRAQGLIGLGPPGGISVFGYSSTRHHHSTSVVVVGSLGLGSYGPSPYCYGLPLSRVTVSYYVPAVAVIPLPRRLAPPLDEEDDLDNLMPRRPRLEPPGGRPPLLPGAQASVFRPIRPQDRARALKPDEPEIPPPPVKKPKRAPAPPEAPPRPEPAPLPGPPAPADDPKTEGARQIKLGKQAYAAREYSRAERRFQQAVTADPDDALAHFLLAQARFALGKYQEAVAAIDAGLRLRPDWPLSNFRPRDLYGLNIADWHDHLKRLADAVARFPGDPFLPFLYAYQLWFDGRQLEARSYFARARAVSPNPLLCERFLQALPVLPILVW